MHQANYETLLIDLKDQVAILRMNRPQSMNALERQLCLDLVECLRILSECEEVRVVIITGSGKAFCAGRDLRELRERMPVDEAKKYVRDVKKVIRAIQNLEKPVIAAVNGTAAGAGFIIAMACDLVVASENATFSQTFVRIGSVPDSGATYFIPRLIGLHKGKELALAGKTMGANELAKMGVIEYAVSHEELEGRTFELARQIAEGAPMAVRLAKKLLKQGLTASVEEMIELESQSKATCMQSEDFTEGIKAFREKRKCRFKGK
jgi:2-(1,2-epoxy-1,2-dihydrophenyl)acetyl-CoA isomerase